MALDKLTQINSGTPVHNVLQTQFDWTALEVTLGRTGDGTFTISDELSVWKKKRIDKPMPFFLTY